MYCAAFIVQHPLCSRHGAARTVQPARNSQSSINSVAARVLLKPTGKFEMV